MRANPKALAALQHGARSEVALAPQVRSMKQALLKRMGLRQAELTWAGRETLDLYARSRAKLEACDRWLLDHPMIGDDGQPAPMMTLYVRLLTVAARHLDALRGVIEQMAREDHRFDSALESLIAEGRKTRSRGEETS
jgi:hypothetical protein